MLWKTFGFGCYIVYSIWTVILLASFYYILSYYLLVIYVLVFTKVCLLTCHASCMHTCLPGAAVGQGSLMLRAAVGQDMLLPATSPNPRLPGELPSSLCDEHYLSPPPTVLVFPRDEADKKPYIASIYCNICGFISKQTFLFIYFSIKNRIIDVVTWLIKNN